MRALPALFITGCSWYLSSLPKIEQMPQFWNADKLVHCICFAGLAFWTAFACGTQEQPWKRIVIPSVIVSLYAIVDEVHQSFTPGRSADAADWVADTVGAVVGSMVFFYACKALYALQCKKRAKNAQKN